MILTSISPDWDGYSGVCTFGLELLSKLGYHTMRFLQGAFEVTRFRFTSADRIFKLNLKLELVGFELFKLAGTRGHIPKYRA